jgi:hypothetical protein
MIVIVKTGIGHVHDVSFLALVQREITVEKAAITGNSADCK